jgi:hypothetical protein
MTEQETRRQIWIGTWRSKGHAPEDGDYVYWLREYPGLLARGLEIGYRSPNPDSDYAMDRLMGWQATGADVPPFGPYANPPTPYHFGPAFPVTATDPPPVDGPPPVDPGSDPHVLAVMLAISARLDAIDAKLAQRAQSPPNYTGHLFGVTFRLTPEQS